MENTEQAGEVGGDFLARMSHELRTPLNAVLGYAQLLAMDDLTEGQRRSVNEIEKAGWHLLQLMDEALEIVRVESTEHGLSLEPVDLVAVVEQSIDLVRPLAVERRVELVGPAALPVYVLGDEQRLRVVLNNLLANAVVYNRVEGRVEVTIRTADGRVRVGVQDTGPGLTGSELERLFVAFERLGAERRGIDGTGLGLTLVKRLTEAMGGTVAVESEPGRGSSFWIELAAAPADSVGRIDGAASSPPAGWRHSAKKTLLYIDDNLPNLDLVAALVATRPEIALITSVQGRLGLELARQHRPDLVLLDLRLVDMHGEEMLAELKRDARTSDIPVVVLSSDAFADSRERLFAAGATGYLTKPLDVRAFLELLDQLPS